MILDLRTTPATFDENTLLAQLTNDDTDAVLFSATFDDDTTTYAAVRRNDPTFSEMILENDDDNDDIAVYFTDNASSVFFSLTECTDLDPTILAAIRAHFA